jgi:hypothetical protein
MVFCEGFTALVAAEALQAISMLAKAVADDAAVMAGHGGFLLDLSGETRQNSTWV